MLKINIVTDNNHYDSILRQLPPQGFSGFQFELNKSGECDVLVVFEYAKHDIHVKCAPANIWLWNMEPPDEEWEWLRKGYKYFSKIVTIDEKLNHPKIIHNQLAIPWQIEKSFKELTSIENFHNKTNNLSFITSNYDRRKGHRLRLRFLEEIKDKLSFDLWGRGFNPLQNKADGLIPYKYTIVIENSRYKNYWSEKLADAFLCGCLPFYYGCPNINDFFDKNAMIKIDISNPAKTIEIIKQSINDGEWEKRVPAINKARDKVLNNLQFFPVLLELFKKHGIAKEQKQDIFIPQLAHHPSVINPYSISRNYYLLKKALFKKKYLDLESPLFGFTTYK